MKKLLVSIAMIFLVSLGAFAQQQRRGERPDPEARAKMMTERMAEELGLNEEQKAKILEINLANAQKRKAAMESQRADREALKEEMKKQDEQIKEILTEEQRKKWEELKETRRSRGPRGGQIEDREEFRKRRGGNL
ncbi:Spy/CpxP family protein refolding chaperone [Algoriphagus formosus]|uniref:DUF4890 domain-containing protein n=1 Tax=Algoriphagus formosus TaxID=2007308 RepID=A0A4R5UYC1_9BACT|nr:DUF4890 domain-containing protein [Algoriphagus aquimaris]TDK44329.1 DUF4890 domain-containing protein [Algoriphagus aquimaris]